MLFMLINRTRADLDASQFEELGRRAQAFYANIPADLRLLGDWGALDGHCTFALLEAESISQVESLSAPFRDFVDIEILPVRQLSGWNPTAD